MTEISNQDMYTGMRDEHRRLYLARTYIHRDGYVEVCGAWWIPGDGWQEQHVALADLRPATRSDIARERWGMA